MIQYFAEVVADQQKHFRTDFVLPAAVTAIAVFFFAKTREVYASYVWVDADTQINLSWRWQQLKIMTAPTQSSRKTQFGILPVSFFYEKVKCQLESRIWDRYGNRSTV